MANHPSLLRFVIQVPSGEMSRPLFFLQTFSTLIFSCFVPINNRWPKPNGGPRTSVFLLNYWSNFCCSLAIPEYAITWWMSFLFFQDFIIIWIIDGCNKTFSTDVIRLLLHLRLQTSDGYKVYDNTFLPEKLWLWSSLHSAITWIIYYIRVHLAYKSHILSNLNTIKDSKSNSRI
jgi:hypothetical protein